MDPAALIRVVRIRAGLTQAELASRAGTSQPVVSAYERGQRDPGFATLRKLVEAGGAQLAVDAITRRTGDVTPPADIREHATRLIDVLSLADAIPAKKRGPL